MLVVFPLILVADTKLLYGYNFVAPLSTTFFVTEILPSKGLSLVSIATSLFSIFTKMPKPLQFFIFIKFGGTCQALPKNVPH